MFNNYNIWLQTVPFGQYTPVLAFGIISFVAAVFAVLLPETKDQKLPDTIKDS